jgi:hypothetical protein
MKQAVRTGFVAISLILVLSATVLAEEFEFDPMADTGFGDGAVTYRKSKTVNIFGLSGFIRTNSASTLGPGRMVVGGSGEFENSRTPEFRRYTIRGNLTMGLPQRIELGLVFPYERLAGVYQARGLEASVKWNFLEQIGSNFPALAVVGAFIAPTGGDIDRGGFSPTGNEVATVDNFGFKFLGVASADVDLRPLDNYIFGLFAEMGIFLRDPGRSQEEKHGLWGLGGVFPFGPVAFILEAGGTIENGSSGNENITRFTPAVRYAVSRFNFTLGYERTFKQKAGFSDSDGVIAAANLKF